MVLKKGTCPACSWNQALFESQGIYYALRHQIIAWSMGCGSLQPYAWRNEHDYKWIQIYVPEAIQSAQETVTKVENSFCN